MDAGRTGRRQPVTAGVRMEADWQGRGEDALIVASAVVEEAERASICWPGDPCSALGCPGGYYSSDLGSTPNSLGLGRSAV